MGKRLFIVSNRLPVSINALEDDIQVNVSSGGLVTAISGYLKKKLDAGKNEFTETFWVGVPGCSNAIWNKAADKLPATGFEYLPVFINKKIYEHYYNGFSNSVIWPLFHYFPSYVEYNSVYFKDYLEANNTFLNKIAQYAKPSDIIWIHDYHLLPLASMIRELIPGITIGFFLHIPFPSYEIFRLLPHQWQEKIMHGILGADLIGFHTIDYASHFLNTTQLVFGLDNEMHILRYQNRLVKIDVFPISIDYEMFNNAGDKKEVIEKQDIFKTQFKDKKIIFSVDRLDYTKGVHNRLKAFEFFLKKYPEYLGKLVFLLVVVPSRDNISKYAERKKIIDEFIGNFNSSIGTINWRPIIYQYSNLEFDDLAAMYTSCHLALITPLRDGMNLVAKEFVASRKDRRGVLVLSGMTGAARELTDALIINPNDIEDIAEKIKYGLEMEGPEQEKSLITMQQRIQQYDVNDWSEDFLTQLKWIKEKQKEFEVKFIDRETNNLIIDKYRNSSRRLFLLDYDGTLVSFSSQPSMAFPDDNLLDLLRTLAEDKKNTVFIISGRDSNTLDKWLKHIPISIIAEHGAKIRIGDNKWENQVQSSVKWRDEIAAIMEIYVKRCANTFVEMKDFSVAWHYRNANTEHSKLRATELYTQLEGFVKNLGLQIVTGNKVIEVRDHGINKGYATLKILDRNFYDFILCCGDDTTDEDMFRELAGRDEAYTIKIGLEASFAKYNLYTPRMVVSLLEMFRNLKNEKQNNLLLN